MRAELVNAARMYTLTKDLIRIDSVSGAEAQIADFLCAHLSRRGMSVRTFPVSDDRHNILAACSATSPRVLFNTHLDTVPPQFGPHEDCEHIYGRGACDTHGILAAQLEAIQDLHDQGLKDIGILLVVGEETTHDGAISAGSTISEPQILIVGEPTENKLMTFQKGQLKADLTIMGVAGHSGYPEKFDSAVSKFGFFMRSIEQSEWLSRNSGNGTTVNVTILPVAHVDNQIPAEARLRLMFRCVESCDQIKTKFEYELKSIAGQMGDKCSRHFELQWLPGSGEPISNLATLPGFETGTAAFNTDIAYFGWNSTRTFLVGPGCILQAHRNLHGTHWQGAEWIAKSAQIEAVTLYTKLVQAAYC